MTSLSVCYFVSGGLACKKTQSEPQTSSVKSDPVINFARDSRQNYGKMNLFRNSFQCSNFVCIFIYLLRDKWKFLFVSLKYI